jgi:argininosuccinate lyase
MKGLPLAYNRDLQEDKQPLFDGKDTVAYSLAVCARMVGSLQFNRNRFEQELKSDFLLATELADYLVRKGMPFRKAHGVVGAVVQYCIGKKKSLHDVSLKEYRKFSTLFADDAYKVLDVRTSLAMKKSEGSTAPWEVQKAIRFWKKELR